MNPHFMFNILNSVQGLIYSNQKSKASEYLGKFSDLMRKILETSDKKEITVEKEFEMLEMYVSLENTRFDNDFNYSLLEQGTSPYLSLAINYHLKIKRFFGSGEIVRG
jgi:sensor histidine kinase YesM